MDVARVSSEAVTWLRRQLERASLAGTLAPRIVNPPSAGPSRWARRQGTAFPATQRSAPAAFGWLPIRL
jgi:hypothetical protein